MTMKTIFASTVAAIIMSGAALAQTPAPTPSTPKAPPAAVTAPAAPAAKAAPAPVAPAAKATTPAAQMVNLNTANEAELDKLDQIGPARAKAIIEARTKGGKFKDWNDFVARNVVPKNAEEAIKAKVRF